MQNLKIAFVTPEAIPFAKTGGLADISGVLPHLLSKMGHQVRLFMPRYRSVTAACPNLEKVFSDMGCRIKNDFFKGDVYRLRDEASGVEIYFIANDFFFNRQELYLEPSTGRDYEDNDERFIFFCRMVLKTIHADCGVTLDKVKAETGWDLRISPDLKNTPPPTAEELRILRQIAAPLLERRRRTDIETR